MFRWIARFIYIVDIVDVFLNVISYIHIHKQIIVFYLPTNFSELPTKCIIVTH